MLKELFKINPCYLILEILYWIVVMLFMDKKNLEKKYKAIFTVAYFLISILTFSYINGLIINIFKLKYLSVKTYLIVIVIVNAISLFTLNKKIKPVYSALNYVLFITMIIILGSTIAIVLGNKIPALYVMDVDNAVNFIDLSMIIFLLYLICLCLTYIGYAFFENKEEVEEKSKDKINLFKQRLKKEKTKKKVHLSFSKKKKEIIPSITKEELLMHDRSIPLYIHDEDCSIIFDDSNQENIYQNYQILEHDIHAKMVNGYTLEENKMLKNICLKLQVTRLANIDMSNVSILNKISIEEYKLLRNIFNLN